MQLRLFIKLAILGGISLLLLIALTSIKGITNERVQRFHEVQDDIAQSYAKPQHIFGPIVRVVTRETWNERVYDKVKKDWVDQQTSALNTDLLYPEQLSMNGPLQVEERSRGIFKALTFQTQSKIEGTIRLPSLITFKQKTSSSIEIVSTDVCLYISDPRGITKVSPITWDGTPTEFQPGSTVRHFENGIHAPITYTPTDNKPVPFSMQLNMHGTKHILFIPVGSQNTIHLTSPWPHPSFIGDFLATSRTISDNGFEAEWNVNALACSTQQSLNDGKFQNLQYLGVSLIDPVTPYSMTDRALKYGFLFIFLSFAAFFLFETIRRLQIHPVQYSFVGLAQALFFLLLLSLSEHIGFGLSYLAATVATIATITVYLCSVLKGVKRGLLFGGVLATVYGVLYGLLLSEDFALVAGSSLIFGALALVMLLTRNIDWYALSPKTNKPKGCDA